MPDWLSFDNVIAPSPRGLDQTDTFAISYAFVGKNTSNNRCTPIFQLWAHVLGTLPPINNISKLSEGELNPSLTTLHDSIACFSGICRPHDDEQDGASVLVYVLNPEVSVKFQPSMVCQATAIKVPSKTVLTVQVRPEWAGQPNEDGVNGVITRLEFVTSSDEDPQLPRGFEERYQQQLWRK